MKLAVRFAAGAACFASAGAAISWIRAGDGDEAICAGIDEDTPGGAGHVLAYGGCGGGLSEPPAWLQSQVLGFALISGADGAYLTDNALIEEIEVSDVANNGYQHIEEDMAVGQARVAMVNQGGFVGEDPSESGGYLGTASYVLRSGTVDVRTVPALVATDPGQQTTTEPEVCIRPKTAGGSCGAADTFSAGQVKFSLFGYTMGSSFAVPASANFLGVRVRASLVNFNQATLLLNGIHSLEELGAADVTSLKVEGAGPDSELRKAVTIDFPTSYNVGAVGSNYSIPEETRTVKIKVSSAGDTAIYIDYLFDMNDLRTSGRYFIYDPTVTEVTSATATTPATATAAATATTAATTTTAATPEANGALRVAPWILGAGLAGCASAL